MWQALIIFLLVSQGATVSVQGRQKTSPCTDPKVPGSIWQVGCIIKTCKYGVVEETLDNLCVQMIEVTVEDILEEKLAEKGIQSSPGAGISGKSETQGILITGGEGSLQVIMSGGANPGVEAELYIPEENKFCKLPNLPETRMTHTMEVVDGTPVICGGAKHKHWDIDTGYTCMQFSPLSSEGEWKTGYAKLRCSRSRHTSWVTSEGEMVQLGGGNCFTGETVLGSTKFNLPMRQAKRNACLIDIGDSVVITGGQSSEYIVEKYNKNTFEKEALPKLQTGRYTHGCGSFKDSDGNMVLVVAGGNEGAKNYYKEAPSTEILKLGDREWKTAAALPYNLNSMASISWAKTNSVFFIGGYQQTSDFNVQPEKAEILAFDGETWKEIAKMSSGRKSSAVTQVMAEDYKEFCN